MKPSTPLSGNCRLFALTPLLALVLLSGCLNSEQERTVNAAAKRYGLIKVGMSKEAVIAKLGEPSSRRDLRCRWETVADPECSVALEIRFDGAEKVASAATTRVGRD
ncbi:MAG: hypothetical protein QM760_23530 [Nibricoccus sp.]